MADDPNPKRSDLMPADEEPVQLQVLARLAGVRIVHIRRYLEFGLLEPEDPEPEAPASDIRFPPASAARVARAERLRRDLNLNYAGAVLVVELLERISELEARLGQPPTG